METAMDVIGYLVSLIEERTGYTVPRGQYSHLERWISRRFQARGRRDAAGYVEVLAANPADPEWKELLAEILVKESSLYRIPEQFVALEREILPRLARSLGSRRELRIWSAGCARGEEPATLALVLAGNAYLPEHRWHLTATDVDERALEAARRGEFGERAVARVPRPVLSSRFKRRGESWILDRRLVERIEFRVFNFFETPYLSLGPPFDVIFLRNVLIYFQPAAQRRVLARVISRLVPGGYLFLGHSETLRQLEDPQLDAAMETLELAGCFVHRRRLEAEKKAPAGEGPPDASHPAPRLVSASRPLAVPKAPTSLTSAAPRQSAPGASLADALRALAEDRLDEARGIVLEVIGNEPGAAAAHALLGLLHDVGGRAGAAVEAYRKTLYLDPGLFQVRLLRAHRFEHLGQPRQARNDYRQVLTDLENGRGRELEFTVPGFLPSRREATRRARQALERL